MYILSHRGLEPERENFFAESSYEAFRSHLQRGFGIEFDLNFSRDNKIFIFHDLNLQRISQNKDKRPLKNLNLEQILKIRIGRERLSTFEDLMRLIIKNNSPINALHFKGEFQKKKYLDILLKNLERYKKDLKRLLIFDLTLKAARYLKKRNPSLILGLSVTHKYDILRYNRCTKGTLFPLQEAIKNKDLFDWVWLDEWDRKDLRGKRKKLYTRENFKKLRHYGFQIALITPELHKTSPGLLGREAHEDAENKMKLLRRIKEIIKLKPNLICTDYINQVKSLYAQSGHY